MAPHLVHVTVVHGRYDTRILLKQCVSLSRSGLGRVSLFVADGKGHETWNGVSIQDVGRSRFGRLGRAVGGNLRMWRALRKANADVVQIHDPELLPLGVGLQLRGARVVFDMHENLPKEILTKTWVSPPARRLVSSVTRIVQLAATRRMSTIFAEDSYAEDFPSARDKVVVLNFPLVDSLLEVGGGKRSVFSVGYIGGISVERGASVLLDAISRLRTSSRAVECVLVGPVAREREITGKIEAGVGAGWLITTGRLEPQAGWQHISSCHVGVAVLQPSPNFTDSYPTKLFEYMALGLPVVVSDFPLWRKVVSSAGCGLLVDPSDSTAVAEAIGWIQEHPEEAEEMGERGRRTVESTYRWENEFKKLRHLYERVLAS